MKKQLLIGMSVVTAAVIMTGCGGGGSASAPQTPTGPQEPAQLKEPANVNDESGAGIVGMVFDEYGAGITQKSFGIKLAGNNPLAKKLKKNVAQQLDLLKNKVDSNDEFNYKHQCSGGGSMEIHVAENTSETIENGKNTRKDEFTINCATNNCDMNGTEVDKSPAILCVPSFYAHLIGPSENEEVSKFSFNGKGSFNISRSVTEDEDANEALLTFGYENKNDNLLFKYDKNTSDNILDFKNFGDFTLKYSINIKVTGEEPESILATRKLLESDATVVVVEKAEGIYSEFNGDDKEGLQMEGNYNGSINAERTDKKNDLGKGQYQGDGFVALYALVGNENNKTLVWGESNNNLIIDFEDIDENTTKFAFNGGIGYTEIKGQNDKGEYVYCGGKATLTTTKDIMYNDEQYGDGDHNYSVLPFEGNLTIEGNGTAYVGFFADDENNTHMIVKDSAGNSEEYNNTAELPDPCEAE
jgi:hypothetical protein